MVEIFVGYTVGTIDANAHTELSVSDETHK